MPDAGSRSTPPACSSPSHGDEQALQLSLEGVLQDVLVQAQASN